MEKTRKEIIMERIGRTTEVQFVPSLSRMNVESEVVIEKPMSFSKKRNLEVIDAQLAKLQGEKYDALKIIRDNLAE